MLAAAEVEQQQSFADFLAQDLQKDLLRFTTAGSVDDGKSTLIGRLLHDAKAVYEDQLASVKKSRINRSGGAVDFSLLTDGLRAEREQGITIDVAYRYFSTARRKFIIADTPGHEQYTRNMATGASTADLALILVDASKGLLPQTRRHAYISALLGIPRVVAAINKMDLVDYRADVFAQLERDFRGLAQSLGIPAVECIPISALQGDNVVERGANMPWYSGATLLEHLENAETGRGQNSGDLRFPVQSVIRPDASFRGFAGRVASGVIRRGDAVLALPSGRQTRVQAIVTYEGEQESAVSGQSVTLRLSHEIDLSRGDLLVAPDALPAKSERFATMVVWLHPQPLELQRTYLLKHLGRVLKARATKIRYRVDVNSLSHAPATQLEMNEIASVEFQASSAVFFDPYQRNRTTGSFILIDALSNATVGAGMMRGEIQDEPHRGFASDRGRRVTANERNARLGHLPAIVQVAGKEAAWILERNLFDSGLHALALDAEHFSPFHLPAVLLTLCSAGFVVIYPGKFSETQRSEIQEIASGKLFDLLPTTGTAADVARQAADIAVKLRTGSDFREEALEDWS